MIYYITGGERSGKSAYAQDLSEKLSDTPYYLATSRIWDDDFKKRVQKHIVDRDYRWSTIEEEKNLSKVIPEKSVVLIDCVTLWLTNYFMDFDSDLEKCLQAAKEELKKINKLDTTLVIVSNEIGMGTHAMTPEGRKFTELQGYINQEIAKISDKAIFMVSGLPLTLK